MHIIVLPHHLSFLAKQTKGLFVEHFVPRQVFQNSAILSFSYPLFHVKITHGIPYVD